MIVHTLTDISTPARYDEEPWATVVISESTEFDGSFAELTTIALAEDDDPSQPAFRDLTFTSTIAAGWFRLTFIDADENESGASQTIYDDGAEVQPDFPAPTVAQVAMLLRARTKDDSMNEVGTFTDVTRPTEEQVLSLIAQGVGRVVTRVGSVREAHRDHATYLASLYTAMLVELSYFPEQVREGLSPYEQLKALFDEGLLSLIGATTDGGAQTKGLYSVRLVSDTEAYLLP